MTNKAFLYLFNTIIVVSSIFAVLSFLAGNIGVLVGFIILIGFNLFIRAMVKADLDEDEERSKLHKEL